MQKDENIYFIAISHLRYCYWDGIAMDDWFYTAIAAGDEPLLTDAACVVGVWFYKPG